VVVTATGRGRKNVVSVRKIWPWSPAFSSGTITVNDILVSVEGQPVEQMGLADVRALLRGEEGSTVIVEMLKHVAGNAPGRVSVHSE
jgi:C-terminal processing protease CtpA/Prc